MKWHLYTEKAILRLPGFAALFVSLLYFFVADIAVGATDWLPTPQPTDPCEVIACPRPKRSDEISPNINTSLSIHQLNLLGTTNETPPDVSSQADKVVVTDEKELSRAVECSKAFKRFSGDGKGGNLHWEYGRNYLDKCFRKAADLPEQLRQQLYATAVALQGKNGESYCTGSLLNNSLVLTARHCLLDANTFASNPKYQIDPTMLANLIIKGIAADGTVWSRKPISIYFDPVDAALKRQLGEDYKIRLDKYPRTLDFVAMRLDSPIPTETSPVIVATEVQLIALKEKQRLLVGFFRQDTKNAPPALYIDDLASCLIREVDLTRGYVHHHCQTDTSVSGTAIFTYDPPGTLTRIGVHLAPAGNIIPVEKPPTTGNEGALIPPALKDLQ